MRTRRASIGEASGAGARGISGSSARAPQSSSRARGSVERASQRAERLLRDKGIRLREKTSSIGISLSIENRAVNRFSYVFRTRGGLLKFPYSTQKAGEKLRGI